MENTFEAILSATVPLFVGSFSGILISNEVKGWYRDLRKPAWNPPDAVFGPVWTVLYLLMGISLYLVWSAEIPSSLRNTALFLFGIQLILNFFWSIIFFKQMEMGWALAEIGLLWVMILVTILFFGRIRPLAAWLMVPYICWVSFATILNYRIWRMNR